MEINNINIREVSESNTCVWFKTNQLRTERKIQTLNTTDGLI